MHMIRISIYTSIFVCLLSSNVFADCDSTANTHYPGVVPPNYYGGSQTDSFSCAINGSKNLTMEQINERADLIPPSLNNRFYVMLGGNAAAEGIVSAKNSSSDTNGTVVNDFATGQAGTLSSTQNKVASNNFELAVGYTWKEFALDLEWLAVKSIPFNSSIIGITSPFSFTSNIKGDALLFNGYWFFNDMYNAKLYGVFSLGYSHNQSTTQIGSGPVNVLNRYYGAGGLGIGARFNVVSSLYADIVGRYIYLGPVRMEATNVNSYIYIKATRTWLGASFRLLWLI